MPTLSRISAVSLILREPVEQIIIRLHTENKLTPEEITTEIYNQTEIFINPRVVHQILKLPNQYKKCTPPDRKTFPQYYKNIGKGDVIAKLLNCQFDDMLKNLYIDKNMPAAEISDYFLKKTKILITSRSIARKLKQLGLIRSLSDAFNLAIKNGRKSYTHLRRTKKSIELRKGIQPKLRYSVLQRDKFKCVLCGRDAKDDRLEIDHIVPVVAGGTNDINNLRTLCAECNKGKMLVEEKHIIAI